MPTCLQGGWRLTVTSDSFVVICTITVILPGSSLPSLLSVSFGTLLALLAQHMLINHFQIVMFSPCLRFHPHFILAWNKRLLFPVIWWFKTNMIVAVGQDFQITQSNYMCSSLWNSLFNCFQHHWNPSFVNKDFNVLIKQRSVVPFQNVLVTVLWALILTQ